MGSGLKLVNYFKYSLIELNRHICIYIHMYAVILQTVQWADPEGGRGSGPPPPEKSQKSRVFSSNTDPEPLENQASIQC